MGGAGEELVDVAFEEVFNVVYEWCGVLERAFALVGELGGPRFEEGVGDFFGVGGVLYFTIGWTGEIWVLVVAIVFINAADGDRVRGCCTCAVLRG